MASTGGIPRSRRAQRRCAALSVAVLEKVHLATAPPAQPVAYPTLAHAPRVRLPRRQPPSSQQSSREPTAWPRAEVCAVLGGWRGNAGLQGAWGQPACRHAAGTVSQAAMVLPAARVHQHRRPQGPPGLTAGDLHCWCSGATNQYPQPTDQPTVVCMGALQVCGRSRPGTATACSQPAAQSR